MSAPGVSTYHSSTVQWGASHSPTTYAPYEHHVYSPNDWIADNHPDFVYTPKNPVQYTVEEGRYTRLALETPLDDFFATFPSFKYNAYSSISDEFNRLLLECLGWDVQKKYSKSEIKRREDVRDAKKRFNLAQFDHFKVIFGVESDGLRAWQTLYKVLGVDPLPNTAGDCLMLIDGVYVNMVDVLDAVRINRLGVDYRVPLFATELELSEYTIERHRFFPFWSAMRSGLMKVLLRRINNPSRPKKNPEPHPSFNIQRGAMLRRLAAGRVERKNARNLEVALATQALKRLEV